MNKYVKPPLKTSSWLMTLVFLFCIRCAFAQDEVKLDLVRNLPIIKGTVNGKDAFFLIDTGASVSVLNEALSKRYGYHVVFNEHLSRGSIVGIGGELTLHEARGVQVCIGPLQLDFFNKACRMDRVMNCFYDKNVLIAGIIGTDLLKHLKGTIDFDSGHVSFGVRNSRPLNLIAGADLGKAVSWSAVVRRRQ